MSRSGAAETLDGIVRAESARDRAEKALEAAERVDRATEGAPRRSRRLVRFLLVLALLGVAAAVVRKLTGGDASSSGSSTTSPTMAPPTEAAVPRSGAVDHDVVTGAAASVGAVGRNGDHPVDAVGAEPVGDDPTA